MANDPGVMHARPSRARRGGGLAVALASALVAMAVAGLVTPSARAEEPTTTAPSSTIVPPIGPGNTTTTAPPKVDPDDDKASGEGGVPEEPPSKVKVPKAPTVGGGAAELVQYALIREHGQAALLAAQADKLLAAAVQQLESFKDKALRLQEQITELRIEARAAAVRAADVRERVVARAVNAYIYGPADITFIFDSADPNEALHRAALTRSVLQADHIDYVASSKRLAELDRRLDVAIGRVRGARGHYRDARVDVGVLRRTAIGHRNALAMFEAGSQVGIAGFVFPVEGPYSFADTFGAPRMVGTKYEHTHEGTDIFAPKGSELYAVERGVVTRVGTDVLGGIKLWLVGSSGVRYYYAHLQKFAPGIRDGMVVDAGELVGFVGNTGNAKTTPPHVHFEIHPGGGPAVNPYPILRVVADIEAMTKPPVAEGQGDGEAAPAA